MDPALVEVILNEISEHGLYLLIFIGGWRKTSSLLVKLDYGSFGKMDLYTTGWFNQELDMFTHVKELLQHYRNVFQQRFSKCRFISFSKRGKPSIFRCHFRFSGSFSRWSNPPVGLPKMMEALQNQNPDWGFRIDIWCFSHEFFVDFPLASISKAALKRNECLEDEMNERLRVQLEENERERKADSWRFSHEKKTIKRGSPTGSFKEKLIKFDGIGQKKPHLLRKTEFHEDGIFAYIYHKDQPKCRCTYIYIYISYMEYLSMFFDFDWKWILKYSTHGAFGKGFCLLLFPEDQSRWVYVGWPRKGSLGRLLGGSSWDLFSWLICPWLVVVP